MDKKKVSDRDGDDYRSKIEYNVQHFVDQSWPLAQFANRDEGEISFGHCGECQ
jgi:hypothetical protein